MTYFFTKFDYLSVPVIDDKKIHYKLISVIVLEPPPCN